MVWCIDKEYLCSCSTINLLLYTSHYTNVICAYLIIVKPLVQKYTDGDDYTIGEEQPITFQCIADGIPVPNIIWTRNGELISLNPRFVIASAIIRASYRPNITHALQSNLTVTSVLVADTGDFLCTASNSVGRDFLFSPFVLNVTASE